MTDFFYVIVLVFTAVTSGSALIQKVEDDYYFELQLGMTAEYPAESCKEIYNKNPVGHNQSGYYWIKSRETTMKVYIYLIFNNIIRSISNFYYDV